MSRRAVPKAHSTAAHCAEVFPYEPPGRSQGSQHRSALRGGVTL